MGDTADWQPPEHIVKSLNSFASGISQQNTCFNMYTETAKQQQDDKCQQIPSREVAN